MKKIDIVDAMNLKEKGTQFTKSVKLKETTYNFLLAQKKENKDMKSIDDVIIAMSQIAALRCV